MLSWILDILGISCLWCCMLANYQTGFGYKLTNGWYARSNSTGRVYERTQTLSTQAWPLSVTDQSSVVHVFTKSVNSRT